MARINKSAEVLAAIAKRPVVTRDEITASRELLNLYTGGSAKPRRRIIDTITLLTKQGFVSVGSIDGESILKITNKGKKHITLYQASKFSINKHTQWKGKWYLITFEIPDSKKATRNNLILQLKKQGFINYTKGLWLLPYEPSAFINSLRDRLGLADEIKIIEATSLPDENKLIKHFDLLRE